MKVTPFPKTLDDVLTGNFLRIPRFQRQYDWDNENLSDFWVDINSDDSADHFMGSIVLFHDGKEKNVLYIVDGQQRITSITILLSIIRDAFDELGSGPIKGIPKLVGI